jgi:predicted NBD/HSP70 family sugar kinase
MPGVTFTTKGALQKSALRQANERLVLNAIRRNVGISRSDLVRLTGLSPSSISFIINRLIRAETVFEERVETHSRVGRRPTALRLATDSMLAIGVDVSSPESQIALADVTGRILRKKLVSWHSNHEILAQRIHSAICAMLGHRSLKHVLGVGVSLQGTIDRTTGRVIAAENLNWFNVELGRRLKGRLSLSFYYENTAKLSALAERWFTVPGHKPLQDFVFIAPTGGLGTGIVTNGHLLQGTSGMGGEFGHIILYPDGRKCPCGNQGCWEQYASDKALCRLYAEQAEVSQNGQPPLDARAIVRLAREGDPIALRVLKKTAYELGLGFVNLIWVLNPEALIVGDFFAEAWDMVEETIWQVLRSRAPHYALAGLRIFPSQHAADSSLLGAISLVFSHFFTRFEHDNEAIETGPVFIHAAG